MTFELFCPGCSWWRSAVRSEGDLQVECPTCGRMMRAAYLGRALRPMPPTLVSAFDGARKCKWDIGNKRQCRYCGEVKPITEFPFHLGRPRNRETQCHACKRREDALRAEKRREKSS